MSAPDKAPEGLPYPAWYAELVDRAAQVLWMHRMRLVAVPFVWQAPEGDELEFLASMVWWDNDQAARVVVNHLRNGEFVCQSKVGDFYAIDPAVVGFDAMVCSDEIEHVLWREGKGKVTAQRARGG